MAEAIQAHYDDLDDAASRFQQQVETSAEIQQRVARSFDSLESGGWIGRGAESFFAEMHGREFCEFQEDHKRARAI